MDIGKAANQRGSIQRLELIEPRTIDQARNEFVDVVGLREF